MLKWSMRNNCSIFQGSYIQGSYIQGSYIHSTEAIINEQLHIA